jgi:hypothetical protein
VEDMKYTFEVVKHMISKAFTEFLQDKFRFWRNEELGLRFRDGISDLASPRYGAKERKMMQCFLLAYQSKVNEIELHTQERLSMTRFFQFYRETGHESDTTKAEREFRVCTPELRFSDC